MATYTVWMLDELYNRFEIVTGVTRLVFHQALCALQPLEELVIARTSIYAAKLQDAARLLIYRNGRIVWGGQLTGDKWGTNTSVTFSGQDHTAWADRTTVLGTHLIETETEAGVGYDVYTPKTEYWMPTDWHADDVCRQLVRTMIAPFDEERTRPWITCDDDAHAAAVSDPSIHRFRGGTVLQALQKMAEVYDVWWRFVPTETGARFTVRYPEWGRDLTAGHDPECVFAEDRPTTLGINVDRRYGQVRNAIIVQGQGGGTLKPFLKYIDEDSLVKYGRAEQMLNAPNAATRAAQIIEADRAVRKAQIIEQVTVSAAAGTWGDKYGLGDLVSVCVNRGVRPFQFDKRVTDVRVTWDSAGAEVATPILEV